MKSRIISIDLAKDVFQVAVANPQYRMLERHRLSRTEFRTFLSTQPPALVLLESCGTAHYWGQRAQPASTSMSFPRITSDLTATRLAHRITLDIRGNPTNARPFVRTLAPCRRQLCLL